MSIPIPFPQLNVLKAIIVPFRNQECKVPIFDSIFVIPVNPESYNQTLSVNTDSVVPAGNEHPVVKYISTSGETLQLDFTLDGTNTIEGYFYPEGTPVLAQIIQLKRTVYNYDSSGHLVPYVKVFWGSLVFNGVISNMNINYTLFNPLGIPIRAKVTLNFTQHVPRNEQRQIQNKRSPDVTHVRDISSEDRLDNMTYKIYKDAKLQLQVAKANNLTSIRKIRTGDNLIFPPIDKSV